MPINDNPGHLGICSLYDKVC